MTTWIFEVPGMSCGHCEAAIKSEVGRVAGVGTIEVDLGTKLVTVAGDDLDPQAITAAVDEAGYEVATQRLSG
jgi:copper chaperone CopZ